MKIYFDKVQCLECKKYFKQITISHLLKCHNLTSKEYKEKHLGVSLLSEEDKQNRRINGVSKGFQKNGKIINCSYCGKEMYRQPSTLNDTNNNFCSLKCSRLWHVGPNSNSAKGKEYLYENIKDICMNCGKKFEECLNIKKQYSRRKFCSTKCFYSWSKAHPCVCTLETRLKLSTSRLGRGKEKRSEEFKQQCRIYAIKRIESRCGQAIPNYNSEACKLFNDLNRFTGWNGQHAENGGEFYISELGYWVDYYEKNLNLVLEYDEAGHYNVDGTLKEKDAQRQKEITEFLDCKFIRIKEEDMQIKGT